MKTKLSKESKMLKRIILFTALWVLLVSLGVYALDIPYVDVEVANSKIKKMEEANAAFKENVQRMTAENNEATASGINTTFIV